MPKNIELKAKLAEIDFARRAAQRVGAKPQGVLEQIDTYFCVPRGRLKLRHTTPGESELIQYERPNRTDARPCRYRRVPVADASAIHDLLETALGIVSVVRKRRELWLLDNVRIHFDHVEGLGEFIEFEAIIGPDHLDETCHRQVEELTAAFGLAVVDLVAASYGDLIQDAGLSECQPEA
jgi:predicted adenylyl cyclase CyaB